MGMAGTLIWEPWESLPQGEDDDDDDGEDDDSGDDCGYEYDEQCWRTNCGNDWYADMGAMRVPSPW